MKTAQEIFDIVLAHARKQKRRCFDEQCDCKYRKENATSELRCFVGALIRDEDYEPAIEGVGAWECLKDAVGNARLLIDILAKNDIDAITHVELLCQCQSIHDTSISPDVWEIRFRKLAYRFRLTYTPQSVN